MSVKPNERIEFFLAKIAGEDIDTNTLTPPGAINATERALDGISERLNDIGSASSDNLPEYSTTDAGKALTVNASGNGLEWAQAQGGSGVFWITAEEVGGADTNMYRLDKTFLEIHTAMRNRLLCIVEPDFASGAPDYLAEHDFVTKVGYDQLINVFCVYTGDIAYKAATINDYPEAIP